MSKSIKRVEEAAANAGIAISVRRMPESTRTAANAAKAVGCEIDQIVKSLVVEAADTGAMKLLLVSGRHDADLDKVAKTVGEKLRRADPRSVREHTGFAIGGVAPIGHLSPLEAWMDEHLMHHDTVWAAAGAPDAVFEITPKDLRRITGARLLKVV